MSIGPPDPAIGLPANAVGDTEVPLLQQILAALGGPAAGGGSSSGPSTVNVGGFQIPRFNSFQVDYYDAAGNSTNIYHQYFKLNGTTVATLTFAYIQNAVTTSNASIQGISQS